MEKRYIIYEKTNNIESSIFKYLTCVLYLIKYDFEYTIYNKDIQDYIFFKGLDYFGNDIYYNNSDPRKHCDENNNALSYNTLGFIKSNFDKNNLISNQYINSYTDHGIYLKNIIKINNNNFLDLYKNDIIKKINNIKFEGDFYFNQIYNENKTDILNYIEKYKDIHYININDEIYLLKDIIEDINLISKYDISIYIKSEDKININNLLELLKNINVYDKNCCLILDKNKDIDNFNFDILKICDENDIKINIEKNDIITNFNIMKQSKIFISSSDELIKCINYLSKTINETYCINQINNIVDEEQNCKYVSSRGILKSCDIRSITPISSIRELYNYNYNFNDIKDGSIIYVCNDAIPSFVNYTKNMNNKFILVSGDSDSTVPNEIFRNHSDFLLFIESDNIIHWYSQNCIFGHPKLTKIPIGLDYHTMTYNDSSWGKKISCFNQEKILEKIKNESKPYWEREIKCYSNFHFFMETKYGYDRKDALNQIDKELVYYENNKVDRTTTWTNQSKYAFVISPHGNGLDCHRTWEALCLNCIPIVKKSGISDLFDDLPVLIVDNWSDINKELLVSTVNKFKDMSFNYNKLTLKYWIDKINFSKKN